MALLNFKSPARAPTRPADLAVEALLEGYSIEVMPRTAARVGDFHALLPHGTRVYIAHIDGTPIEDMVATARRLSRDGFAVMPHFPARLIPDAATLENWIAMYQGEAGVAEALVLAGGLSKPKGAFDNAMQLLETGLFDKAGFRRLHVAGHPEGNRDIDPDGGTRNVTAALNWKQAYADRTDARMAIVTQFAFEAAPIIAWADRLRAGGIDMPIHVGVAGPAKLQTLIRYAIACGVGPSLAVLQRRARDVSKLLVPYTPAEVVADLAAHKAAHPDSLIAKVHFFPLGGVDATSTWAIEKGGAAARPASAASEPQR